MPQCSPAGRQTAPRSGAELPQMVLVCFQAHRCQARIDMAPKQPSAGSSGASGDGVADGPDTHGLSNQRPLSA